MWFVHSWADVLRTLNLIVGFLCFVWSIGGLVRQYTKWNTKTRDLWYSRLLWALVQCVLSVEGLRAADPGWTVGLGLITIAGIITFKGLNRRGKWGYDPDE